MHQGDWQQYQQEAVTPGKVIQCQVVKAQTLAKIYLSSLYQEERRDNPSGDGVETFLKYIYWIGAVVEGDTGGASFMRKRTLELTLFSSVQIASVANPLLNTDPSKTLH